MNTIRSLYRFASRPASSAPNVAKLAVARKRGALASLNMRRNWVHTSSQDNSASKLPTWSHQFGESSEYHRTSTRYSVTPRETLAALDVEPKKLHLEPQSIGDKISWKIIRFLRIVTDAYFKDDLINRAMMLETVAAVPGMVAGMTHHLSSLRKLRHDNWIKTLLDEAENERMHLMTFMDIRKPDLFERLLILSVQGVMWNVFFLTYLLSPRLAHRFVGYLEEEAVKTYSHFLEMIDSGKIKNVPAPDIAKEYWGLPADATLRDVVLVIRADEMDHRDVNHTMSNYIIRQSTTEYREINIKPSDLYTMEQSTTADGKSQSH